MKIVVILGAVVAVLGLAYFVMQSRQESEVPTSGLPESSVSDTEVNSTMPVPGSNVEEMLLAE